MKNFPSILDRAHLRADPDTWQTKSKNGVVSSAHFLASQAGAQVLAEGGNAFDAAIATSLALGVAEPAGSGLGGMALGIAYRAKKDRVFSIESPCRAPRLATPELVSQSHRYRGYRAVAVPGMVKFLGHLHQRYSTQPRATLIEPALKIAREGFPLSAHQQRVTQTYLETLRKFSGGKVFLDPTGNPLPIGTMVAQPHLAKTLERFSEVGFDDFYTGDIATEISRDMATNDGFVTKQDLAEFPDPKERAPLTCQYLKNVTAHSLMPPGGGIALIEMLKLANQSEKALDLEQPEDWFKVAQIIQKVRKDRVKSRLDLNSEDLGTAEYLLSPDYIERSFSELSEQGSGETSHFSIIDREGNAIGVTQSIERSFGSAETTTNLGFLYNGFLRAFKVENQRHPYYLAPGKAARSNASPSILFRDRDLWAVLGSTGSERSTSGIFEVTLRLHRQTPFEAVHAPRFHCTPEGILWTESDPPISMQLQHKFKEIQTLDRYAFKMGGLHLALKDRNNVIGVADPRRDGLALGG